MTIQSLINRVLTAEAMQKLLRLTESELEILDSSAIANLSVNHETCSICIEPTQSIIPYEIIDPANIKSSIGVLASRAGYGLPITVCKSNRGYYIGTKSETLGPISRESVEYYSSSADALVALVEGTWTQRLNP